MLNGYGCLQTTVLLAGMTCMCTRYVTASFQFSMCFFVLPPVMPVPDIIRTERFTTAAKISLWLDYYIQSNLYVNAWRHASWRYFAC